MCVWGALGHCHPRRCSCVHLWNDIAARPTNLCLSVVTDTATGKQQNSWASPPTPGNSGQRKRKVQLLPSRRGDQLTLVCLVPPPSLSSFRSGGLGAGFFRFWGSA